jgi:hypothetical protein
MLTFLALALIGLAYWTRSTFLQIMSGILAITAGISYIAYDPTLWESSLVGIIFVAIGLYQLISVAVDLVKGD